MEEKQEQALEEALIFFGESGALRVEGHTETQLYLGLGDLEKSRALLPWLLQVFILLSELSQADSEFRNSRIALAATAKEQRTDRLDQLGDSHVLDELAADREGQKLLDEAEQFCSQAPELSKVKARRKPLINRAILADLSAPETDRREDLLDEDQAPGQGLLALHGLLLLLVINGLNEFSQLLADA